MPALLPVDEALRRIAAAVRTPAEVEIIPIADAVGRVLAAPLIATRTQPPFPASAMDGYAVRAADLNPDGPPLTVIGESAAGRRFAGSVGPGEAVRIFTGAPVPEGADTILIQENAVVDGASLRPTQTEPRGRFVRSAGLDFSEGQTFFAAGYRLRAKDMALAASLGAGTVAVRRKPKIALLATGDELVLPGETPGPDQIVAANHIAMLAMIRKAGGEARFLGVARDDLDDLARHIENAIGWGADALVTQGGASVGDHDLVQAALARAGLSLDFWKIAMRPGKPLMFGTMGRMLALGLPGNPASAIVCAHVFLKPMIAALAGEADPIADKSMIGALGRDLPGNDLRQEFMRATLAEGPDGRPVVTPLPAQDSSLTRVIAEAEALVIRPAHAPPARAGDACRFLLLD